MFLEYDRVEAIIIPTSNRLVARFTELGEEIRVNHRKAERSTWIGRVFDPGIVLSLAKTRGNALIQPIS
jgi:hypothetical protein